MSRAIVLVDYDNVRPVQRETNADIVEINLLKVADGVSDAVKNVTRSVSELHLRLYGGWTLANGRFSDRGNWLFRRISAARGLRNGIRILPEVALSIAKRQERRLLGLLRVRRDSQEQKMVDAMLCVDLLHYATVSDGPIFVATDDDDIVPALLAVEVDKCEAVCVLRHRESGIALNDDHLRACRVRVELLPSTLRRL